MKSLRVKGERASIGGSNMARGSIVKMCSSAKRSSKMT